LTLRTKRGSFFFGIDALDLTFAGGHPVRNVRYLQWCCWGCQTSWKQRYIASFGIGRWFISMWKPLMQGNCVTAFGEKFLGFKQTIQYKKHFRFSAGLWSMFCKFLRDHSVMVAGRIFSRVGQYWIFPGCWMHFSKGVSQQC